VKVVLVALVQALRSRCSKIMHNQNQSLEKYDIGFALEFSSIFQKGQKQQRNKGLTIVFANSMRIHNFMIDSYFFYK